MNTDIYKGFDGQKDLRYDFFLIFLNTTGKIKSFHDDRLQNLVYRAQHDLGIKIFNFDSWHFGPYSNELDNFISNLEACEQIKYRIVSTFEEEIDITEFGKLHLKIFSSQRFERYLDDKKLQRRLKDSIRKNKDIDIKFLIEENSKSWIAEQSPEKQTDLEKAFLKI